MINSISDIKPKESSNMAMATELMQEPHNLAVFDARKKKDKNSLDNFTLDI